MILQSMNICLFTQEELNKPLAKHDPRTEHIVKVLHKKAGDTFDAGIINGMAGIATITKIEGDLYFTFEPKTEGKPLYPLTLIIGFPRPIQLRRLLRDVAGLGACAVHLTGTELGDPSYLKSTVVDKGAAWNMLLDGTAQAAGTHVPELIMHNTLKDCLSIQDKNCTLIALDNKKSTQSLHSLLYSEKVSSDTPVIAAIGSERGWTDRERDLLQANGFTLCSMGPRVLRTETAATVASSIILDFMGKLN